MNSQLPFILSQLSDDSLHEKLLVLLSSEYSTKIIELATEYLNYFNEQIDSAICNKIQTELTLNKVTNHEREINYDKYHDQDEKHEISETKECSTISVETKMIIGYGLSAIDFDRIVSVLMLLVRNCLISIEQYIQFILRYGNLTMDKVLNHRSHFFSTSESLVSFTIILFRKSFYFISNLGYAVIRQIAKSEVLQNYDPSFRDELLNLADDIEITQRLDVPSINTPDEYLRSYRDDTETKLDSKYQGDRTLTSEREPFFDEFNNIFHSFRAMVRSPSSSATKIENFWESNLFRLHLKKTSQLGDNMLWFSNVFLRLLLFNGTKAKTIPSCNDSNSTVWITSEKLTDKYSLEKKVDSSSLSSLSSQNIIKLDQSSGSNPATNISTKPNYPLSNNISSSAVANKHRLLEDRINGVKPIIASVSSPPSSYSSPQVMKINKPTVQYSRIISSTLRNTSQKENKKLNMNENRNLNSFETFFPDEIQFFYQYIIRLDSGKFNYILSQSILEEILSLSECFQSDYSSSSNFKNPTSSINKIKSSSHAVNLVTLPPSFTIHIAKLKLLGKFLGLLEFYPEWPRKYPSLNQPISRVDVGITQLSSRGKLYPIKMYLEDAYSNGRLSLTVPWLVDFLRMGVLNSLGMSKYKSAFEFLKFLQLDISNKIVKIRNVPPSYPNRDDAESVLSMSHNVLSSNRVFILLEIEQLWKLYPQALLSTCSSDVKHLDNRNQSWDEKNDALSRVCLATFYPNIMILLNSSTDYISTDANVQKSSCRISSTQTKASDVKTESFSMSPKYLIQDNPQDILKTPTKCISLDNSSCRSITTPTSSSRSRIASGHNLNSILPSEKSENFFLKSLQSLFWQQHLQLQQIYFFVLEHVRTASVARLKENIAAAVRALWASIAAISHRIQAATSYYSSNDDVMQSSKSGNDYFLNGYKELVQSEVTQIQTRLIEESEIFITTFIEKYLSTTLMELCTLTPAEPMVIDLAVYLIKEQVATQYDELRGYVRSYGTRKLQEVCNLSVKQVSKSYNPRLFIANQRASRSSESNIGVTGDDLETSSHPTIQKMEVPTPNQFKPECTEPVTSNQSVQVKAELAQQLRQLSSFIGADNSKYPNLTMRQIGDKLATIRSEISLYEDFQTFFYISSVNTKRNISSSLIELAIVADLILDVLKLYGKLWFQFLLQIEYFEGNEKLMIQKQAWNSSINVTSICTVYIKRLHDIQLSSDCTPKAETELHVLVSKFTTISFPIIACLQYSMTSQNIFNTDDFNIDDQNVVKNQPSDILLYIYRNQLISSVSLVKILNSLCRTTTFSYYESCIGLTGFMKSGPSAMLYLMKLLLESSINDYKIENYKFPIDWYKDDSILYWIENNVSIDMKNIICLLTKKSYMNFNFLNDL